MDFGKLLGKPDKTLGGYLQWPSILSRSSTNSLSFTETGISANSCELLGSRRLYLLLGCVNFQNGFHVFGTNHLEVLGIIICTCICLLYCV